MDKHKKFHIGVKAIITNRAGEMLLFQVNPATLKDNTHGTYWDIPGGRIEASRSVEETLRRELQEEAGITTINGFKFFHASISNIEIPTEDGNVGLALFIYTVEIPENPQITLSAEHQKYQWFTPQKSAQLLSVKYPPDFTDRLASFDILKI